MTQLKSPRSILSHPEPPSGVASILLEDNNPNNKIGVQRNTTAKFYTAIVHTKILWVNFPGGSPLS